MCWSSRIRRMRDRAEEPKRRYFGHEGYEGDRDHEHENILSFRRNHMLVCFGNKPGRGSRVGLSGWNRCSGEQERSARFSEVWLSARLLLWSKTDWEVSRREGDLPPTQPRPVPPLLVSFPAFFPVTLFGKGEWFAARRKARFSPSSLKYPQCSTLFSFPLSHPPSSRLG